MENVAPRRLAAVWFADIVGYSSLSSHDEDAALALVRGLQDAAHREVEAHGGRVVKFVGDAVLAVFESVDGALRAALELHVQFEGLAPAKVHESRLRIGLHMGEITEAADGDVYGDGVNMASRLQGKARPGEVVVSRAVKEMIRGRPGFVCSSGPRWRLLKGMGFNPTFVVTAADAPPPPRRRLPARAIGVGLAAGISGFVLLMTSVAMRDDGDLASEGGQGLEEVTAVSLEDGNLRLNLGVDHYFAGELDDAVTVLEPFGRPPLRNHPEAPKALRYAARAHFEAGHPEEAREDLERMVESEPPMALLIPSAEDEALMNLYYEARRGILQTRSQKASAGPVGAVVLFDLEVGGDVDDPNLETLGATVANMLGGELDDAGLSTQYFWALMVGVTGERAYREFRREPGPGSTAPTHVLMGRVALRDGEVAVSTQVYELASGALVSSQTVPGAWPDGFFEVVEQLGLAVAQDLGDGPGE